MNAKCGICEYKGDLADAPFFICLDCGDAIRRLVWIRNREQQAATASFAAGAAAAITGGKAAAPSRL